MKRVSNYDNRPPNTVKLFVPVCRLCFDRKFYTVAASGGCPRRSGGDLPPSYSAAYEISTLTGTLTGDERSQAMAVGA